MAKHPEGCPCPMHIAVQCEYCDWQDWGTPLLGKHIKQKHPEHFIPRRKPPSAVKLAAKVLQAHNVAKEMKRLAARGIRYLPKGKLDASTVQMIQAWANKTAHSTDPNLNLLMAGLDSAETAISSVREFTKLKEAIKESAKLNLDGIPAVYEKKSYYNPEVAGEILKLAFSLNKSWDFTQNLLLLYGLESLADEIATVGPHPPTEISSPSKSLSAAAKEEERRAIQTQRDAEFAARNKDFNPKKHLSDAPYIVKAPLERRPSETDSQRAQRK